MALFANSPSVCLRPLALSMGMALMGLGASAHAMDTRPSPAPTTRASTEGQTPDALSAKDLADARALIKKERFSDAIALLKAAGDRTPNNADIYNLLGYTHRKSGQLPLAFEYYAVALRMNPNHQEAHEYVGEAYLMDHKLDKAQEHLDKLASLCKTCEPYTELSEAIEAYKAGQKKP